MSVDLRALLADASQCGAYFVDVRDRAAVAAAARSLDFALVEIDFAGCTDKADALQRIATALRFPAWFGANWDALADCLDDLSWWPAPGYVLLLDHVEAWREHARADCDTVVDILGQAAAGWAARRIALWALLPMPAAALATIAE